jgi:hypothetical protein
MTDRQKINQALAKTLAYIACGKFAEARNWLNLLNAYILELIP